MLRKELTDDGQYSQEVDVHAAIQVDEYWALEAAMEIRVSSEISTVHISTPNPLPGNGMADHHEDCLFCYCYASDETCRTLRMYIYDLTWSRG